MLGGTVVSVPSIAAPVATMSAWLRMTRISCCCCWSASSRRTAGVLKKAGVWRLEHELAGGAQRGEIVELRRLLARVRRANRHHRPSVEVARRKLPEPSQRGTRDALGHTVGADVRRDLAEQHLLELKAGGADLDRVHAFARGRRIGLAREARHIPVHVARARGVQRVAERDRARRLFEHDAAELLVCDRERIGRRAVVVDLIFVEEGVELLKRRRHHQLLRGEEVGDGLARVGGRDRGARDALAHVLHERRDAETDGEAVRRDLIREVGSR